MNKTIFLALTVCWSFFATAEYDLNPQVQELVASGKLSITKNSLRCNKKYTDLVSNSNFEEYLCANFISLPKNVLSEIYLMQEQELENISDYDQRITALFQFSTNKYSPDFVSNKSLRRLANSFNIEIGKNQEFQYKAEIVSKKSFSQLEGLTINDEYTESSRTLSYLRNSLEGQLAFIATFGKGVDLYPGGGFNATYYLIITSNKVTYVKLSWWDA